MRVFFEKRFGFVNGDGDGRIDEPQWEAIVEESRAEGQRRLDVELRASGYLKPRRMKRSESIATEEEGDYGSETEEEEEEYASDESDDSDDYVDSDESNESNSRLTSSEAEK